MRSICVPAALAAAMSTAVPAYAAGEWPDGPNRLWFENLQRPDNHLAPERWTDPKSLYCCGIADTVKTKFKVEPGDGKYSDDRWYAWLKEEWVAIPAEKTVPDFAPDGQAYLFLLAGTIQCFVKPKGGL
jgi:hypothetical protein